MSKHCDEFCILGCGPYSRALSGILRARLVRRRGDEGGWSWPRRIPPQGCSLVLVIPPTLSHTRIIRWHADAWQCNSLRQARCGIICFDHEQANDLRARNVFGRTDSPEESFANWSRYIAIIQASASLSHILKRMHELIPLPIQTWTRKAREASIIPAVVTALKDRDKAGLSAILSVAACQDWDAICPSVSEFGDHHEHADRIRRWLASVTRGVTPPWDEGMALFNALTNESCKTTSSI